MARPDVLHLIETFHQGGSERQAVQLVRLLHTTGRFSLHVACLRDEGVLRRDLDGLGLPPIEAFPLVSFQHPTTAVRLATFAALLRRRGIALLHTHDFYTDIFGMAAGLLAGVPVRIASRRESDPGRTKAQRFVERRAFDCAHGVVVNAEASRRDLIAHGVDAAKIHTVYNGIDVTRLASPISLTRAEALSAIGVPPDGHRVFVTILANLRLVLKDHPTFLRAAQRVKASVPEAGFIIAGEGELLEPMRQLAAALGLAGAVFFTGPCQRVPELLAASDVCVLSSTSEGFPNVIVEYMAAGRPVVATDVGGVSEAVVGGRTGYVVPPGDDAAMAARVTELLTDETKRDAFGRLGRAISLERFSCEAQLRRTVELYERLLGRRLSPAHATLDEIVSASSRGSYPTRSFPELQSNLTYRP